MALTLKIRGWHSLSPHSLHVCDKDCISMRGRRGYRILHSCRIILACSQQASSIYTDTKSKPASYSSSETECQQEYGDNNNIDYIGRSYRKVITRCRRRSSGGSGSKCYYRISIGSRRGYCNMAIRINSKSCLKYLIAIFIIIITSVTT